MFSDFHNQPTDDETIILKAMYWYREMRYTVLQSLFFSLKEVDDIEDFPSVIRRIFPNTASKFNTDKNKEIFRSTIAMLARINLIEILHGQGVISFPHQENENSINLKLTEAGKAFVEGLQKGWKPFLRTPSNKQIFLAYAFRKDSDPAIKHLIDVVFHDACQSIGYRSFDPANNYSTETITQKVISGITRSDAMIADLTYARPSVYYEVGVAHQLGMPLVLTCREDYLNANDEFHKVHVDLANYEISYWKSNGDEIIWLQSNEAPSVKLAKLMKVDE